LDGNVTTTGAQTYNDAITLGANTTFTGTTLAFAGITGGGNNLTLANSGQATLSGMVSGVGTLTANKGAGASLVVDNDISGTSSIVDDQNTTLNGHGGSETVTTTGTQTYANPVTLGANTTTLNATVIYEGSTIKGTGLTINAQVLGIIPTGLLESPVFGPEFNEGGSTVIIEDVLNGIFATVAVQPETASTVGSEPSQEKPEIPPGAHLIRSGNVN
jgi:hypothetical protein